MPYFDTDDFADMNELVDADIDRVDLVGKAANGHRFILAKSGDANLFPADLVRELIKTAEEKNMSEEIVKEDLDASVVMAEPEMDAEGDAEEPGSPAWEAIDAATAAKWTAILARAKNAICELREREKAEVEAGHEWDEDGVEDLKDVVAAVDYAISLLAPFAVNEAAEAAHTDIDMVAKAAKGIKSRQLATLEQFAPVVKAGRTLSAANESALKDAADAISKILETLPKAPVSPVEGETNLGAESENPEPISVEKDRLAEIVDTAVELAEVVKADDLSMATDDELARMALTGVDAERTAALQEIGLRSLTSGMTDGHDEEEETADEESAESAEEQAAEEMNELDEADGEVTEPADTETTPAKADEVGTPAEGELKKTSEKKSKKVAKVVKAARDEEERLSAIIKGLEDRIAHLEAPAASKVLANGALPPAHLMRGQDAGASSIGDAALLRKRMDDAPDAVAKSAVAEEMRIAALEALAQMSNH